MPVEVVVWVLGEAVIVKAGFNVTGREKGTDPREPADAVTVTVPLCAPETAEILNVAGHGTSGSKPSSMKSWWNRTLDLPHVVTGRRIGSDDERNVYTAEAPAEAGEKKYDETSTSMMAVLRYGSGIPWIKCRQRRLQRRQHTRYHRLRQFGEHL